MRRRARQFLSVLVSLQLAAWSSLPPSLLAQTLSPEARLVRVRRDFQINFATLRIQARFPAEELSQEFSGLGPGSGAEAAWKALAKAGSRYEDFRGRLMSLADAELAAEVKGLGQDLGLSEEDASDLVPRYQWLRSRMSQEGVSFKDGAFVAKDGQPFSPEAWDVMAGRGAALTEELAAEIAAKNKALLEIHELARKGDHRTAAAKLNELLEGMVNRPELIEKGFGNSAVETTLSLINETGKLLDKEGRRQVRSQMGKVDSQLKQVLVANRNRLDVPSLPGKDSAHGLAATPFGTQLALSFYAALSQFSMTADWAKARFYVESTGEALRVMKGRGEVASYGLAQTDPLGNPGLGYEVVFKDGSRRYEGYGGLTVATSIDGRIVTVDDKANSALSRLVDGKEVAGWTRDPKSGELRGHFQGTEFTASKDMLLMFSDDGETLFFADGLDEAGKPRIVRWIKPSGRERGRSLPNGMGHVVAHVENGKFRKDVVLDPSLLQRMMSGKGLDLSPIPDGDLPKASREVFERVLRELPNLHGLASNAMAGKDGRSVVALYIRDGRLYLALARDGEAGDTYTVETASDGKTPYVKMFVLRQDTQFMYHFDMGLTACEQYAPDHKVKEREGRVAFAFWRRLEKQGHQWKMTKMADPEEPPNFLWEATKSLGADALGVMGKGVEIVFSPFQTLLYDILGLFHLATGACIKFFDKHNEFASFEQISAFYTLAQAKFNSWMISGLMKEGQDPVVQQYRAALRSYFADSSNRSLLDAFLDGEVEKMRRRRYGELYRFHEDDPYTEADRAYMAAGIFGYANLAAQYFAEGKESWQQGGWRNKLAALPSYAAGGFVIAGEAYVEGLGFGLAAAPLKLGAAGARAGLSTKQVALAMQASKGGKNLAALSKAEQSAVKLLNNINRAELAAFLAPAGIHTGASAIQWIDAAFINKDPEKAWAHFDAFFSGAAGFGAMGIGLLQARVTSFAARANAGKLKAPLAETKVAFDPVAAEKVVADLKAQGKPDAAKLVESILTTDARSGMPNRAFLEKNAPELLSKAKDPAVAIMDMNNLGAIQDGLIKALGDPVKGKLMTDQIIGKTGELINSIAAEHGVTVGRLSAGGEEFAVLGSKAQVAKFLERVQLEFADGRVLKEAGTWAQGPGPDGPALGAKYKTVMQSIQDTVIAKRGQNQPTGDFTFGVAEVTKGRDLHATLKAADLALTKAKDSGLRGSGLIEVPGKGFEPFKPSGEAKAGPLTPVEVEPLSQSLSRLKGMMSEGEFQQFLSVFAKDFTGARTHEFVAVLEIQGVGSKGGDIAVTSSRDFKILNDAAGHEAGDAFLAAKQKLLAETVAKARAEGLDVSPEVVRLGAKEFALFGKDAGLVMTEFSKSWNQAVSEGKVISQADWAKIKEYAGSHPEISEATLAGIGKQRVVTRKLRADEPLASGAEMAMGDLEILKAAEKPFGLGKLLGKPAKINPNEAPENVRALTRQNETAQTLYKNGYVVEQRGAAEGADFKLNGTEFDCYSPATGNERNIWGVVKDKIIQKKQGRGVVLNLDDSAVSLEALRSQFSRFAIEGLESVLVVKNGEIVPLMKGGKVLAKGDPVLSLGGKPYMADKPELVASAEAKVYLEEAWKAAEARLKEIDAIRAQKGLKPLTEAQSSDILLTRLYRELNPEKGAKGRKRGKGGIVILDNDAGLKGMDPKMAERLKVVMDHHGPYFDAKNAEVDATMRLLSFIDEVMLDPGPTEAKIQYLRQRFGKYSTNNLGDGAWAAWIVDNISLVARDPALRGRIRQATWFEDFGFFGNKAKETAKGDPALGEAIELQQSVFDIYDQALRKHGVKGVDRFDSMPAETQKVLMQEVMAEMSKVVADPKTRGARAGRFRSALEAAQKQVEAARIDLSGAKSQLKNEGFSGKALDDMFVFSADKISAEGGVFANWGGPSQAHDMPLQLSFKSLAADPMGNGRTQFILAVPNGKAAATLKPLGEAISKANLEKAKSLGVGPQEAGMVMGRDALQFAFPPGILLTPTEILLEIGRFRSKVPQN